MLAAAAPLSKGTVLTTIALAGTYRSDHLVTPFMGGAFVKANRGDDVVWSYLGETRVRLGPGADTLHAAAEGRVEVDLGRDADRDTLVIGGNGQEFGRGYGGAATVRSLTEADTIRFADPGAKVVEVAMDGERVSADVVIVVEQLDGQFTLRLRDVDLTAGLDPISRDLVDPDGAAVDPASGYYEVFDLAWY